MSLDGKRALITGASGALGAAVAQRLARDGAVVLLHANSRPEAVEQLAAAITAAGGQAECHVFDLGSDENTRTACERLLTGGPVQILVNNAGVHDDAVLPGMRAAQWHKVIDVSLNGFFRVTQPLLLPMLRTRWGRIINMSSVASLTGNRGQVNYAAAKGALNSATKALSLEVAARGVTVNAIAPGPFLTDANRRWIEERPEFEEEVAESIPLGRWGRPEEIAPLALYLASEASSYMTGSVLVIDGGKLLW